jgi:signal transduction histidine kinase
VSTAREGDEAVIRVADSGIGIDADLLPRIFDLFAQGEQEPARGAGGLGVGLTLVQRLAELHGGTRSPRPTGRAAARRSPSACRRSPDPCAARRRRSAPPPRRRAALRSTRRLRAARYRRSGATTSR